jgi:tripartite-type tricarboxylate transporter receptor subunit TctC
MNPAVAAAFAAMTAFAGEVQAAQGQGAAAPADYPSRPIRFLVGFPPGGGNDLVARMAGQKLSERFGRPVVIDNRPGAGGNLAAELVAKAPPDGYSLLMISASHPIQGLLKKNLPYDPIRDFSGIAQLVVYRSVLVVNPGLQATSVRDLVALARSRPGTLNFASAGNGSASHLTGELFKVAAGVNLTHVPYKGTGQAITDLMGGRVQLMFTPIAPVVPQIQSGRLRGLAVTSTTRSRILPDLPTVAEAGVPGYEVVSWFGIVGPPALPAGIAGKLNVAVKQAMESPDIRDRLAAEDMEFANRTPGEFDALRRAELAKWSKIIKQTGIQAE